MAGITIRELMKPLTNIPSVDAKQCLIGQHPLNRLNDVSPVDSRRQTIRRSAAGITVSLTPALCEGQPLTGRFSGQPSAGLRELS
jgi:hypothetical protein